MVEFVESQNILDRLNKGESVKIGYFVEDNINISDQDLIDTLNNMINGFKLKYNIIKLNNDNIEINRNKQYASIKSILSIPVKTYIDRMIEEYEQLSERTDKINAFIDNHNPMYTDLPQADKSLLNWQSRVMKEYRRILEQRIDRAKKKEGIT